MGPLTTGKSNTSVPKPPMKHTDSWPFPVTYRQAPTVTNQNYLILGDSRRFSVVGGGYQPIKTKEKRTYILNHFDFIDKKLGLLWDMVCWSKEHLPLCVWLAFCWQSSTHSQGQFSAISGHENTFFYITHEIKPYHMWMSHRRSF
jgi:hypothetical protein